jgi:glutaredoxin 3
MPNVATVSSYGVDTNNLLENAANDVENFPGTKRPDTATFDAQRDVASTPLIFVDDEPIGGVEDLRRWLARNAH